MPLLPEALPDVTVAGRRLAGPDLAGAADAVAGRVQGASVVAVDAVAALETVVAVVGCLRAGVPVVPVPPDSGPRERAHLLRDSRAELWLGSPREDVTIDAVPVDVAARPGSTWTEREAPGSDDGTALIMYTSGTTGAPKGAVLSRRAIAAGLDGLRDAWAWTPDDTLVHGLPLFHVHGLILGVLGALRIGSPLVHTGRPTPGAYAAAGGTLYFGVPTVWGRVAADPAAAAALRGARLLVSGSAGLPAPVFHAMRELSGQGPVERYGMTETLITLATRADGPREPGVVGTPLTGVDARIVDDAGAALRARRDRRPAGPRRHAVRPLPERTRRPDRRRVVPDRRRGRGHRGRQPPHRGPGQGRPDQERRPPHRRGRDRGRAARATRPWRRSR